jgi:hypothetical protein
MKDKISISSQEACDFLFSEPSPSQAFAPVQGVAFRDEHEMHDWSRMIASKASMIFNLPFCTSSHVGRCFHHRHLEIPAESAFPEIILGFKGVLALAALYSC